MGLAGNNKGGECIKAISVDLPRELDKIEIHPLADLHIGDAQCEFKRILEEIEYIKNTPNAYCVLDGDLMDSAIASSIGDTYGSTHSPMEQLRECTTIFAPIANKIIAVTHGNHENRYYKTDGLDLTEIMCAQLGMANRYSPTTALIYVRFGHDVRHNRKICYTIYMTHGSGGGRKEGGKINRLADLAQIIDTDIYIMAHVHQPASLRNCFYRTDPRNNSISQVEHLFVNTAAWLKYGGYGDVQGYKPASNINPIIFLDGRAKKARALV